MGRKKIKIQPIKEDRNRSVTYLKRKSGLFKKAHELAVLTDADVAVIVFGHNGKLAEFCSGDIDQLLLRYTEYDGVAEKKGPQHYIGLDKDSGGEDGGDDGPGEDGPDKPSPGGSAGGSSGSAPGPSGSNNGGGGSAGARGGRTGGAGGRKTGSAGSKRKAEGPPSTSRSALPPGQGSAPADGHVSASIKTEPGLQSSERPSSAGKSALNTALRQRGKQKETAIGLGLTHPPQGHDTQLHPVGSSEAVALALTDLAQPQSAVANDARRSAAEGAATMARPPSNMQAAPYSSLVPPDSGYPNLPYAAPGQFGDGHPGPSGARRTSSGGSQSRPTSSSGRPVTAGAVLAGPHPTALPQSEVGSGISAQQQKHQHQPQHQTQPQHYQQQQRLQLQAQRQSIASAGQGLYAGFTPSLAMQHQGHNEAVQAATAAAAYAMRGAQARSLEGHANPDGMQVIQQTSGPEIVVRSASTGNHRSHHSLASMDLSGLPGAPSFASSDEASPASVKMARPYTASGDFAAGHLAPPGAGHHPGFNASQSPASIHAFSASPMPSMPGSAAPTPGGAHEGSDSITPNDKIFGEDSLSLFAGNAGAQNVADGSGSRPRMPLSGHSIEGAQPVSGVPVSDSSMYAAPPGSGGASFASSVPAVTFNAAASNAASMGQAAFAAPPSGTAVGQLRTPGHHAVMTMDQHPHPHPHPHPQLALYHHQMPAHLDHRHAHIPVHGAVPRAAYDDPIAVSAGLSGR